MRDGGESLHDGAASGVNYSPIARVFHWLTAALVAAAFPIGLVMHDRGYRLNLWDGVTNTLFSTHKLIGFVIFCLVLVRLAYRVAAGAPSEEPTLTALQVIVSRIVHWLLYGFLIAVALTGWIGVQLFPSTNLFGLFSLPSFLTPDNAFSKKVFEVHAYLAYALGGLVSLHIGAALFHHFIRRDNVLIRMWPGLRRRG